MDIAPRLQAPQRKRKVHPSEQQSCKFTNLYASIVHVYSRNLQHIISKMDRDEITQKN